MKKFYFLAMLLVLSLPTQTLAAAKWSGEASAPYGVEYDFGNIDISGGVVSHTFTLENRGKEALKIKGGFTSCKCTTAKFLFSDGSQSKNFGMSLPKKWIRAVKPGESFKVVVKYDPMAHGPDISGPFKRDIYVVTSAPHDDLISNKLPIIKDATVVRLQISGTTFPAGRVPEPDPLASFPVEMGDFHFAEKEYDFGTLKQSQGLVRHDFPFIYTGEEMLEITGALTSCECAQASVSPTTLKAGDRGVVTVTFDPNLHKEPEGKFFKTIMLRTKPEVKKRVEILIWAEIDLDLGPEHYKLKGHHD